MGFRARFLSCLVFCSVVLACSSFPHGASRKQALEDRVRQFHVGLLSQNRAVLIRQISREEKGAWELASSCYFKRYRVIDFSIDEIKFDKEAKRANAAVSVTSHSVDSLVTHQEIWRERWNYRGDSWVLDTGSESLRRIMEACSPP